MRRNAWRLSLPPRVLASNLTRAASAAQFVDAANIAGSPAAACDLVVVIIVACPVRHTEYSLVVTVMSSAKSTQQVVDEASGTRGLASMRRRARCRSRRPASASCGRLLPSRRCLPFDRPPSTAVVLDSVSATSLSTLHRSCPVIRRHAAAACRGSRGSIRRQYMESRRRRIQDLNARHGCGIWLLLCRRLSSLPSDVLVVSRHRRLAGIQNSARCRLHAFL
jgi:hypothetical protein